MKKNVFHTLNLICLLLGGQTLYAQGNSNRDLDFEKMTFEVSLNKSNYLPYEPIVAIFKFSNQTTTNLKTINPEYSNELSLRIKQGNKIKSYFDLFGYSVNAIRFPRGFSPATSTEDLGVIRSNLDTLFPKFGVYQLEFVLSRNGFEKTYKKEITVKEPLGIDREAFEYLNNYKKTTGEHLYFWRDDSKLGSDRNILQEFVDRYGSSVYGEYSIFRLGNYYLYEKKDLDKAAREFGKLKTASNFSNEANRSILEIETKKKAILLEANSPQQ